jgi:hypothetical protein
MLALQNPSERLNGHGRLWMHQPYANCLRLTKMGLHMLPILVHSGGVHPQSRPHWQIIVYQHFDWIGTEFQSCWE